MTIDSTTLEETLKKIQNGLKDKKLRVVGKAIGLSYPTLKKLADGTESNPRLETMTVILDYLNKN